MSTPHLPVDTVSVTCCIDERAHEVPDAELAVGATRRNGYFRALCGHMIAAAPMVMPDGAPCGDCAELLRPTQVRRRASRRAWLPDVRRAG